MGFMALFLLATGLWPLVQFPGPWGKNQTLLIDFLHLMIEYWVSIDHRRAIFIHDFRWEEKSGCR